MKKIISAIIVTIMFMASVLIFPTCSSASSNDFSKGMMEEKNNVYKVSDTRVLIKYNNELKLVDVIKGKVIKQLNVNQKVLDVHTITNPNKIVLITQTGLNKLQKHVYNDSGVELSEYGYALNVSKDFTIKWVAPNNGVNERLMIQQGNLFSLYQSTGTKPLLQFDARIKDTIYEYVNVDDWDFRNYPYLVIKYAGSRTMATDYFVRIINLYTKKIIDIDDLAINRNIMINNQNLLELSNSYTYPDIFPANSTHADPTMEQSFHSLYSLDSGKQLVANKAIFKQVFNHTSGWETQIVGGYVFVQDLESNLWSLYQSGGSEIVSKQVELKLGSKFLTYNAVNHTSYFLVADNSVTTPIIKAFQMK